MPIARPRPVADLERLERLQSLDVLDSPAEPAFDNVTTLAARLLRTPVALVSFVDEHRQFFKSCFGTIPEPWMSERETPLSHSFCRHVVERAEPLIVRDAREHPLVCDNLAVEELGVIAYVGMPILTGDGLVLGSLCTVDVRPRDWTDDELSSLSLLAESLNTEIDLRFRLQDEALLRRELESAEATAVRANEAKDRLLANVSHELRTPLSGVLGFAELLDDDRLDDEQRSYVETVIRSGTALLELVDGLLRYVDLESTLGPTVRTAFDPAELLGDVERAFEAHRTSAVALRLEVDEHVPDVLVADSERVRAVLSELVSNALRFTDRGEIEVGVTVSTAPGAAARLAIGVRDTGIGITPDRLGDIFAPLTGHDGSGQRPRGGLGMGLALARLHAEALGGAIRVESSPGDGSTFTLSLPVEIP
ncbi:MAG: ATP-binding protein [Gemmatimonadota bacterium]|nr:ATP-binding protein [Gemmatimonadota bacterium]